MLSRSERLVINELFAPHGLHAYVFHSRCGSAYVSVREAVDGGSEVALIRLSGHREGAKKNATHRAIGDKETCMKSLRLFAESICREFKEADHAR